MQDVDLFLSLAEIAGVFIGFGALIAVRSGGTNDTYEVAVVGMVAWFGVCVVVAALAPVVLSRFGVTDHPLWLVSSLIVLVVFWGGNELLMRISSERRRLVATTPRKTRAQYELVGMAIWVPMTAALLAIMLGLRPDLEPALYFASVALLLLLDSFMLLMVVTRTGRPQSS